VSSEWETFVLPPSPALSDGGAGFLIVDFIVKNKGKSLSFGPLDRGGAFGLEGNNTK
jgi:hypothetical protein